jgi:hypothetical protein
MDFQPWLPLFALLGGAAGAAVINLGFGWWKVRADRKDEHSRWLRDQRQAAYGDYLESTRRLFEWLTFTGLSSEESRDELVEHLGKVDKAQVLLLGPLEVCDAAEALYRSLQDMLACRLAPEDPAMGIYSADESLQRYSRSKDKFLRLCREDLERL